MGSGQVAQPSTNKVSKCPVVPYDELAGALCRYGRKLNGKPHVNGQKDQETLKDVEIIAYSDEELSHPGPGTYERPQMWEKVEKLRGRMTLGDGLFIFVLESIHTLLGDDVSDGILIGYWLY